MRKTIAFHYFFLSLVAVFLPAFAFAASEYFVCGTNGNDSNNGLSEGTAFKTIQYAVSQASADDIVTVLPGDYMEQPVLVGKDSDPKAKTRLFIGKKITLRSRDGAAATSIIGAHDANGFYGMGENAVSCIKVASGIGPVIKGFTLRDGASRSVKTVDNAFVEVETGSADGHFSNKGGAVGIDGYATNGNSSHFFLEDCIIENAVATRGGGIYGGTAVRCLFKRNRARNYGAAGRNCSFYNCILMYNSTAQGFDTASEVGVVAYYDNVVGCTFAANGNLYPLNTCNANGGVYNSVFVDNALNNKATSPEVASCFNCVFSSESLAEKTAGNGGKLANILEIMDVLGEDFRLVSSAASIGSGNAEYLAKVPEAYRNTDFNGNPRQAVDGNLNAGAVQSSANAVSSVCLAVKDGGSLVHNGYEVKLFQTHASTDRWPAKIRLSASPDRDKGVVCYLKNNVLASPDKDDSLTVLFPQSGIDTFSVVFGRQLYVDPVRGDDKNDGSKNAPFKTLVHPATNHTQDCVIYAAEGDYREGGYTHHSDYGVKARVCAKSGYNVRFKALGDCARTVIYGESDPDSPDGTGCGPNAMRCVQLVNGKKILQGFTLTGGRVDYSSTYSDMLMYSGGAAVAHKDLKDSVCISDCVITDCCAGRGAAGRYVTFLRCSIKNCFVANNGVKFGNSIARESNLIACLVAENFAGENAVVNYSEDRIVAQCTIVKNTCTATGTWRSTCSERVPAKNCVLGKTGDSATVLYGGATNPSMYCLVESGAAPETSVVDRLHLYGGGDYRVTLESRAVGLADVRQMASVFDINGNPYEIDANGKFLAGCYAQAPAPAGLRIILR